MVDDREHRRARSQLTRRPCPLPNAVNKPPGVLLSESLLDEGAYAAAGRRRAYVIIFGELALWVNNNVDWYSLIHLP